MALVLLQIRMSSYPLDPTHKILESYNGKTTIQPYFVVDIVYVNTQQLSNEYGWIGSHNTNKDDSN
jgi:hypothetical protein